MILSSLYKSIGIEMKKFLSLTLILATTVSVNSCTERTEGSRRPDAVYERTLNNPELGGATSITDFDSPISDNIGSTRLFSGKRTSESKTKLEAPKSLPKVQEEVKAPVIKLPEEPEIVEQPTIQPKIEIADEQATAEELSQLAPQVTETNLNILNMQPVPENENIQVINVPETGVSSDIARKYIRQPAQPAAVLEAEEMPEEVTETATIQEKPQETNEVAQPVVQKKNFAMPASIAYKMSKGQEVEKTEVVEEEKPTVIEKVAEIFTGSDDKEEEKSEPVIASSGASELPAPEAVKVGECMAKATIPGEYKEVEEQVLIAEAYTKKIDVPAEYKEVEEEVVVTPEKQEEIIIPAVYKDVEENVLVKEGSKSWKKVDSAGDVMQLVEEKPVYKNVIKKVLVEAERRETKITPAVTKTVKKNVLVKEASKETIEIPAKYETVKRGLL